MKLAPFSHTPGTQTVIPGSGEIVEIYPTLIRFADREYPLSWTGPVKEFTVQLDLEKGDIKVWGHYNEGFLRYRISCEGFTVEKGVLENVPLATKLYIPPKTDRLSLGVNKSQDWDAIHRREDLKEILPFWLRLGQLMPLQPSATISLSLPELYHAGFIGILSPHAQDTYKGVKLPSLPSPLSLLTEGAKLIKDLFITIEGNTIEIHPPFTCGKYLDIDCGSLGMLNIEWTKNFLRKVTFHPQTDEPVYFKFPKSVKTYRESASYHFDNFKK